MWDVTTTDEFDGWFEELDDSEREEIFAKVALLRTLGPQLARPHADTLNGSKHANMKELRADTQDQVMRIVFAFDPERSAILLVGGNKAGVGQRRFYQQLIAKADRLYDAHLGKLKEQKKRKGK
jgi:hypothetical protein